MKNFFISDTHFGHYNVIEYSNRPFKTSIVEGEKKQIVTEMNDFLIEKWNSVVSDEDTVYFIGDFAFLPLNEMKKIMQKLKGEKILIKGNHDRSNKQMIEIGFKHVYEQYNMNIGGYDVLLCHYPYVDLELHKIAETRPHMIKFVQKGVNPEIPKKLNYDESKQWLINNIKKPINTQTDDSKDLVIYIQRLLSKHIGTRPLNNNKILLHGHTHSSKKRFANMINCSVEAWDYTPASEEQIIKLILEWEEEINGLKINEQNGSEEVYQYYSKLRFLIKDDSLKKISDLAHLMNQIIFSKENKQSFKLRHVPQKYSKEWYVMARENNGFIPLQNLKDKTFYKGSCRNAEIAYWLTETQKFYYMRSKFGSEFIEDIEALENDNGFDVFVPHEETSLSENDASEFVLELNRYLRNRQ